jgi:hypothetical protein
LITRTSPLLQQTSAPPMVAPKPSGKIITEYRTVRRLGNGGETTTMTTGRHETPSPTYMNDKRFDSDERLRTNSATSHDALMESIRQFGGSQSLGKK